MDVALDVSIRPPESSGIEVLKALSKQADLVFIGLRVPAAGDEHVYASTILKMVEGMPTVIFVRNASRFHGRLI
jgi:hypothetical protein